MAAKSWPPKSDPQNHGWALRINFRGTYLGISHVALVRGFASAAATIAACVRPASPYPAARFSDSPACPTVAPAKRRTGFASPAAPTHPSVARCQLDRRTRCPRSKLLRARPGPGRSSCPTHRSDASARHLRVLTFAYRRPAAHCRPISRLPLTCTPWSHVIGLRPRQRLQPR